MPLLPCEPTRVVEAARLQLERAGSPSYIVALVDETGASEMAPMVFAQRGPAQKHADALAARGHGDVAVVAREECGRRAVFTVFDGKGRKVHQQLEIIETSVAEDGLAINGKLL